MSNSTDLVGTADIKYVEVRYHLAAAVESALLCYWLTGDINYHHEGMMASLTRAAKHLGFELVPVTQSQSEAK